MHEGENKILENRPRGHKTVFIGMEDAILYCYLLARVSCEEYLIVEHGNRPWALPIIALCTNLGGNWKVAF